MGRLLVSHSHTEAVTRKPLAGRFTLKGLEIMSGSVVSIYGSSARLKPLEVACATDLLKSILAKKGFQGIKIFFDHDQSERGKTALTISVHGKNPIPEDLVKRWLKEPRPTSSLGLGDPRSKGAPPSPTVVSQVKANSMSSGL